MRKVFVILALLILAAPAFATNLLVNDNFEDTTDHALGWNLGTGAEVVKYPSIWNEPGQCPAEGAGKWGLHRVTNGLLSDIQATQRVNLTAGEYTINGSGWFRLYSGLGTGVSNAKLILLVDNTAVATSDILQGANGTWNEWTQVFLPTWTGTVNSNIKLRASMHADGESGWGEVVGDSFILEATPAAVPEPGTIVAACTILGPVGLVFRRRKH